MIQPTAPLTKRQLVLLQTRKSLEHELSQIEAAKYQEVTL